MPIVELCVYCGKILDTQRDQLVELAKETHSQPRSLAHVACQQRVSNPPPVDDGGSWMSR